MFTTANRLDAISYANVSSLASSSAPQSPDGSVKAPVEIRRCTRRGCKRGALEDSEFCRKHEDDQRRYNREYMARRRAEWDAENRCTNCGAEKRKPGSKWCSACLIRYTNPKKSSVKSYVEINAGGTRRSRVAAATLVRFETDGFKRSRYLGRQKRGAPSLEDRDRRDHADIQRVLARYGELLDEAYGPEYRVMSRVQQEATRRAAHAGLALVVRLGMEALAQYGYEMPKLEPDEIDDLEDEGEDG